MIKKVSFADKKVHLFKAVEKWQLIYKTKEQFTQSNLRDLLDNERQKVKQFSFSTNPANVHSHLINFVLIGQNKFVFAF